MNEIIVIGASGFVGRALTLYLNEHQYSFKGVSRSNKEGLTQVHSYRDCPSGKLLIHLAEESDIHKANSLGEEYLIESNTTTQHLCDKFEGKVIYCSSAAVYGDKNKQANSEQSPIVESSLYSRLKRLNEKTVLDRGGCVLRVANIYGGDMSVNNVLSDIINQIGRLGPVRLRSTSPIRDFLYIQDLISAIALVIDDFHSGLFNVGSGAGFSIEELAKIILAVSGETKRQIISVNTEQQFSVNFLDTTKIKSVYGWHPRLPLQENIRIMLQNRV